LRQAILAESHHAVNLADLIRSEALSVQRPPRLLLPVPALALPSPRPIRLPAIKQIEKGQTR
jgi:hypothetical protein